MAYLTVELSCSYTCASPVSGGEGIARRMADVAALLVMRPTIMELVEEGIFEV